MNFKQLPNGMCDGFVILKRCDEKTSKNGSMYLDLIFADKAGEISAKLWDYKTPGLYKQDMIVKVRGTVELYNGKEQFRISQMRPTSNTDDYNLADLVPASEVSGSTLFDMIRRRVVNFEDEDIKAIVLDIIDSKKDKLVIYPAALKLHHAMVGGLLYHTMSILRMAEEVCKIYPNVNRDLLSAGVILHDVAKTWELESGPTGLAKGYTVEGDLIGHLVKGAMYVEQSAQKLHITSDAPVLLEHMILSHHGQPDYGAAVRPMFLEAEILSSLDALDATIFEINSVASSVMPKAFSDRQWALDNRKIYNHGRSTTDHKVNFGE